VHTSDYTSGGSACAARGCGVVCSPLCPEGPLTSRRHGCVARTRPPQYTRGYMIALLQYGIALRVPLDLNILSPT
jgi:hypothetical protein